MRRLIAAAMRTWPTRGDPNMLWQAFGDPRSAVRRAQMIPVLLAFLGLLAIELSAYQIWLAFPPFRNLNREAPSASDLSRSEPRRELTGEGGASTGWSARASQTWRVCRARVLTTTGEFGMWFLIGLATTRRWSNARAVAAAVVCSACIMTAGRLARQAFTYAVGVDPGLFGFAAVTEGHGGWIGRLGRLTVFEIWSAVVLAVGLAEAWRRPFQLVLPAVLGASLAWMLFPSLRDPHVWLPLFGSS